MKGVLQPHKWENCYTLDKGSWGFVQNSKIEDYITPEELIKTMVETVSCGGNYLINVGPTKEGVIVPIQQERLLQLGEWLGVNGEAIYDTVPWTVQNDTLTPGVW
jgi:alpha-L-fucosidase